MKRISFYLVLFLNLPFLSFSLFGAELPKEETNGKADPVVEAFAKSLGVNLEEEVITPGERAEKCSQTKMDSVLPMLAEYKRTGKVDPRMLDKVSRFEHIKRGIISFRTSFHSYMKKINFEGDFSPGSFLYDFNAYFECAEERSHAHDQELVKEAQTTISFLEKERSKYLSYIKKIKRQGGNVDDPEFLLIPAASAYIKFLNGIQKRFREEIEERREAQRAKKLSRNKNLKGKKLRKNRKKKK